MKYQTPSFIRRRGIVLSKDDVPFESALTFNAGINRFGKDGYVMLFRNDYSFCRQDFADFYAGISDNTVPKTNWGLAYSSDGVKWQVEPSPLPDFGNKIGRLIDPRITDFGTGEYGLCFAASNRYGYRGGVATTRDFHHFEIHNLTVPYNIDLTLFPEKINGKYCRLERPFNSKMAPIHGIWLSCSPDLVYWGESRMVLMPPQIPFSNFKIGPAAPPVKTPQGWLTLFHAVEVADHPLKAWERDWNLRYYAGIMLLDLNDPGKIVALADKPLIVPETDYECDGFRGEVIFPGGLIAEPDGTAKIYYGAADTVECLAEAKIDDLIEFCFANNSVQA